jgi:hypothetical protein
MLDLVSGEALATPVLGFVLFFFKVLGLEQGLHLEPLHQHYFFLYVKGFSR